VADHHVARARAPAPNPTWHRHGPEQQLEAGELGRRPELTEPRDLRFQVGDLVEPFEWLTAPQRQRGLRVGRLELTGFAVQRLEQRFVDLVAVGRHEPVSRVVVGDAVAPQQPPHAGVVVQGLPGPAGDEQLVEDRETFDVADPACPRCSGGAPRRRTARWSSAPPDVGRMRTGLSRWSRGLVSASP
jgi:hypothetical protein